MAIDSVCVIEHYDPSSRHYRPAHVWRTNTVEFAINSATSQLQNNPELNSMTINDGSFIYNIRRA
jgi:hypothetical protein